MDERARRLLERARGHYRSGLYDKAEKALVPLARDRVPFADVYAMLGAIHYQKGRLLDAVSLLDEALRLNPGYTEAALHLVLTYNDLGKYEEAKSVHERMLASRRPDAGPDNIDPFVKGKIANMHAEVGRAYEQAGLYDEATQEYRRALSLCPTYADIRTRLGGCLRVAGNLTAAERELVKVKKEHPNLVAPRLQLGMTYFAGGKRKDAAREWREALAMEPENKFAKLYVKMLEEAASQRRTLW